ncbi:MAG: fumarate hydratase [Candidatus Aenigmarchaeota archaeon]
MLTEKIIVDLYRKCATELPSDIIDGLKKSMEKEGSENAREVLGRILENVEIAREESRPICQDTGIPIFYVETDGKQSEEQIRKMVEKATVEATDDIPLRPNAVDPVSSEVAGNRPVIHFKESDKLKIDLMMKGGGSENVSKVYSLPDSGLKANRDIRGIKKCVLDAVVKAQGKGCPPYIIGVAIGGSIEEVAHLSKKQLLRKLDDRNDDSELKKLEEGLLEEINKLGIGPSGLGGKTTALGVKATKSYRHPASFFVGIAFSCWALRRHLHGE